MEAAAPVETLHIDRLIDDDNPWPGLSAFRERDELYFRGRDAEIDTLCRTVQSQRLTVLFGASGLGKTSLLQAGLFPRLRRSDEFPVSLRLDVRPDAPDLAKQVFSEIGRQAQAAGIEAPERKGGETLWEYLHRRNAGFWSPRNRLVLPVLVFDQFEEVFSRGLELGTWTPSVRACMLELADVVEGRPPVALRERIDRAFEGIGTADADAADEYVFSTHRYRVVLSLREDYLAALEEMRSLMPSIGSGRIRLLPMTGTQALEVVDQTKGRLVTRDVAVQMVRFAAGRDLDDQNVRLEDLQLDPSLLSLFCRALNDRRLRAGAAQITESLVRSHRANILQDFYEDCMREVSPAARRFVEDQLLTATGLRDSRAYENAIARDHVPAEDLARLVAARLLRIEDRGGVRRIELTHDVLTGVTRASRDGRHEREEREAERVRLEEEREQTRIEADQARERAEIQTKIAELKARTATRSRLVAALLGVVVVGLGGLGYFTWKQKLRAELAENEARALNVQLRKFAAELSNSQQVAEGAADQALAARLPMTDDDPDPLWQVREEVKEAERLRLHAETNLAASQREPSPAAQSSLPASTPPRVYIQVPSERLLGTGVQISRHLRDAGFTVPPIEVVPVAPRQANEVRYFRMKEQDKAEKIGQMLSGLAVGPVKVRYVPGYENTPRIQPRHYEIWLAPPESPKS